MDHNALKFLEIVHPEDKTSPSLPHDKKVSFLPRDGTTEFVTIDFLPLT